MGLFGGSSAPPAQLTPFNPPLGVLPHFCVAQPTTLVMKEAAFSFSGDDFSIVDSNKVEVLKCHGKSLGFGDKKGECEVDPDWRSKVVPEPNVGRPACQSVATEPKVELAR